MDPVLQGLRRVVTRLRSTAFAQTQALGNLGDLLDVATAHIPRTAIVDISGLLANSTTPKTATWVVPVAGDYRVVIQPVIAAARLGTIFATIVAGTKTPTSVDISVVNSAGTTLAAGVLDVVIHPA
jgi:hypothetical protein